MTFTKSQLIGLGSDRRGSINILAAAVFSVAVSAAALAIDMASLYVERRSLQGVADLAAMAGANVIDRAEAAVAATLDANGVEARYTVIRGRYVPDPGVVHTQRFVPGQQPYNAIRVALSRPGRHYFSKTFVDAPFDLGVMATAATRAHASFSVGSRLLAVRDGLANQLLGALVGGEISLSVMDYEALLKGRVQVLDFMNALATELDITAGTYQSVLESSASLGEVVAALEIASEKAGDASASAALAALGRQLSAFSRSVPLTSVIALGPLAGLSIGDTAPGLDAAVHAMDLFSAAAVMANGRHQVDVALSANIPGLARLTLRIAIGEPMQSSGPIAVGQPGSTVHTAQLRLRLIAETGGIADLGGLAVRLPLYIDIASAKARLASIACSGAGSSGSAIVATTPSLADVWIGEVADAALGDFRAVPAVAKANIVDARLLSVRARAHVNVGNVSETPLEFTPEDVEQGTIKRTGTRDLTRSLLTTLVANTDLEVRVLGLGIGLPGAVQQTVAQALAAVAAPLDALVHELLSTLGVHLGEADVRVNSITCGAGGSLAG